MTKDSYYAEKLSSLKLKRCYEIASTRIKQYLQAEIDTVKKYLTESSIVLELGCGYGRVLPEIAQVAKKVVGIDLSEKSINYALDFLKSYPNIELFVMDAKSLSFSDNSFDIVLGIQNAISSFKIPPKKLLLEALRVVIPGGKVILTSYSEKIWPERLQWFYEQSAEGLLGEIDPEQTKDGTIVCKDGFKATTFSTSDFQSLIDELNLTADIFEIDNSSLFCVITK